jgi:glycosyltransferase involved in cell wall biosynthesis
LAAETVERIGCGLTAAPGSAESIAAAIRWLLANPEASAEMGARGRAFVIDAGDRESKFGELLARLDDELRRRR